MKSQVNTTGSMKGDVKRNSSPLTGRSDTVVVAASPCTVMNKPVSGILRCLRATHRRLCGQLNSMWDGMSRPWIYLSLEGYRCFRSCEGG